VCVFLCLSMCVVCRLDSMGCTSVVVTSSVSVVVVVVG